MKIYPSYRYQMRDQFPAILVYYGVLVAMVVLSLLFIPFSGDADFSIASSGITAVTMIFSFVLSLCAFKDSFLLNIQHGVSRRSHFLARLGAMGTVCAIMAVVDELYTLLMALLMSAMPGHIFGISLYELVYSMSLFTSQNGYAPYPITTNPSTILLSIVFNFFVLMTVCAFAYLVSIFNYRLNKAGKIIFWVGWPFLFILIDAFLTAHPQVANALVPVITRLALLTVSTLPRLCVTCLVLTAVFSALAWLLMRRTWVK